MGRPDQNNRMRAPGSLDLTRARVIGAGGWDPIRFPTLFLRITRPGGLFSGRLSKQDQTPKED
jgi:hypothetical protein